MNSLNHLLPGVSVASLLPSFTAPGDFFPSSSMNRLDQVPAIVRQNVRTIQSLMDCCANGYRATVAQAETWLANHAELRVRYKEKFSTWELACEHVYGVTRQAVHKKLLKISDGVLDVSATLVAKEEAALSQVEEARKPDPSCVPVELRDAVVEHINHAHKPLSSASIRESAPSQTHVPQGATDAMGFPLPKDILPQAAEFLDRREEIKGHIKALRDLIDVVEAIRDSADPLYSKIGRFSHTNTLEYLQHAKGNFEEAIPHAVCPYCGGLKPSLTNCAQCRGTGLVSKHFWDNFAKAKLVDERTKYLERMELIKHDNSSTTVPTQDA